MSISSLLPLSVPLGHLILEEFFSFVSGNRLNGTIKASICSSTEIAILDISNNFLTGEIPDCLGDTSTQLIALNLQANMLTGTIPTNFTKCDSLKYLDLSYNQLEGVVPKSLSQCQNLSFLNLENNMLKDKFPSWLESLPQLQVLSLSYNSFHGLLLTSSSKVKHPFPKIQIFDLSNNKFCGELPTSYIKNFAAMMDMNDSRLGNPQYMGNGFVHYHDLRLYELDYLYSSVLTFNRLKQKYTKIITSMVIFDVSNNNFKGEIPDSIGQLLALRGLNFSHNHLTGHIPPSIGKLSLLDFLDLSSNRLTGRIPQELVSITFLEIFNVSKNLLEGSIPHGNNFDTFLADSYMENLGLCGQPLAECRPNRSPSTDNTKDDRDASDNDGNALSMWETIIMGFGSGMIVGVAWGYHMLSVGKPYWFIWLAHKMELALLDWCEPICRRGTRTRTRARRN